MSPPVRDHPGRPFLRLTARNRDHRDRLVISLYVDMALFNIAPASHVILAVGKFQIKVPKN